MFCIGRLSEGRTVEVWIRCAKYCRWSHTICDFMEDDLVVKLVRGNLNSVNNLSAVCVNYSLPHTRKALLVDMELLRKRILQMFFHII